MGEMLIEGSEGTLRLDGDGGLWLRSHGEEQILRRVHVPSSIFRWLRNIIIKIIVLSKPGAVAIPFVGGGTLACMQMSFFVWLAAIGQHNTVCAIFAGSNDEVEQEFDWHNHNFGGDCVYNCQRHVVAHLTSTAGSPPPLMNTAKDYLAILKYEQAVYESSRTGSRVALPAVPAGL